jgi:hypothetical protein
MGDPSLLLLHPTAPVTENRASERAKEGVIRDERIFESSSIFSGRRAVRAAGASSN